MTTYTVLIPSKIAANSVDAWVRPVVSASVISNGMVFNLNAKSTETGYTDCWKTTLVTTGSLSGLWMALEPEVPWVTSGNNTIQGLGTVRDFYTSACTVFSAFKVQVGDVITVTSDAFVSGTVPTTGQYAVSAVDSWLLTAQATTGAGQSWRFLGTKNIPYAAGSAIGTQRLTGYQLECIII
jgi:hypothetical protein